MRYFPLFFDLTGQKVLIVGGGEVALRKILLVERSSAQIFVVAPEVVPEIAERAAAGGLQLARREFELEDLNGVRLAVVATSRRAVNRWIAKLADTRGIAVNVVDDREASRVIVPAIIDRDPVLVAVSTGGTSPVLARRLRERLEAFIPARFGELALWLQKLRKAALENLRDTTERRRFFEAIIDGEAARRLIDGDAKGAERIARRLLATRSSAPPPAGEVVLVGAGPGDPELLTLKALRALQDADVIFYDRLVAPAILDLARRDAARISVGKSAEGESTSQAQINASLIEHARQGKRVVRLKGGDPFIFGRGGEEMQALAAAGVHFSAVPGITAAAGCAAAAGIPLTHRDHAHTVTFVTGHADQQGREPDWRALAQGGQTVVFYMGLKQAPQIAQRLMAHGAPGARPAAIIERGTTPEQRVITATLETLDGAIAAAAPRSPTLLVVGDVVSLHSELAWNSTAAAAAVSHTAVFLEG